MKLGAMPEFADIYVLSKSRKPASVLSFLDTFAARREEAADEYEIPQYSQSPTHIFSSAEQLIDHCCSNVEETHAIYWRISSGQASHAMVFFLSDGHVIYGLSVDAEDKREVEHLRQVLADHVGSSETLELWESPPPDSALEFRKSLSNGA
jgi:hypothetical protein